MRKIYLFKGTMESYLDAVERLWKVAKAEDELQVEYSYNPGFFEKTFQITSLPREAVYGKEALLLKKVSRTLMHAFSSGRDSVAEKTPFFLNYFKKNGSPAFNHMAEPSIRFVINAAFATRREAHRIKGLLRFRKIENLLYAPYFSKTFVMPLLGSYFKNRLPDDRWIIHDRERNTALFYDEKVLRQIFFEKKEVGKFVKMYENEEGKDLFELLWKKYFKTIAIENRKNLKLQKSFMPEQYWRYIPELSERVT
ncbi:MAG: TIGR03915 family putative DNA repair protein [bacterium]